MTPFTSKFDLHLRKELVKSYTWSIALYGAETWTVREVYQKCLGSFAIWCYRRMEKISWTDHVKNEVLHRMNWEKNNLHTIKRRKANWVGQCLRRNCLLKYAVEGEIEGKIEVTGKHRRTRKQLLDDLKETRRYRKLKQEAPGRTVWRVRFLRGCELVRRSGDDCGWINRFDDVECIQPSMIMLNGGCL
jgi:hypothetical protein